MTKLSDLDFYQSPWLSLTDLSGRAARVTISEVSVEEVRQRDSTKARKAILSFAGKKKRLIANHTQAHAAAEAWGDVLERWVGKQCILQSGRAKNGKETILLVPVPPATAEQPPEPPAAAEVATGPAAPGGMSEAEAMALWAPNGGKLVDPALGG